MEIKKINNRINSIICDCKNILIHFLTLKAMVLEYLNIQFIIYVFLPKLMHLNQRVFSNLHNIY